MNCGIFKELFQSSGLSFYYLLKKDLKPCDFWEFLGNFIWKFCDNLEKWFTNVSIFQKTFLGKLLKILRINVIFWVISNNFKPNLQLFSFNLGRSAHVL